MVLKYGYCTRDNWIDELQKHLYAKWLRKTIELRGKTEALQISGKTETKINLVDLNDSDITPENGYYIFPEKNGVVQKVKPETDIYNIAIIRENENGQEWAIIKESWESLYTFDESQYTESERDSMGAVNIENSDGTISTKYYVEKYKYDFNEAISTFSWDEITDTVPTWKK